MLKTREKFIDLVQIYIELGLWDYVGIVEIVYNGRIVL